MALSRALGVPLGRLYAVNRRYLSVERQVRLESQGDVCILMLDRPKANAMGRVFVEQLNESLEDLESSSTRCVIVTSSSSKVFSAGADLKERAEMNMDEAEAFVCRLRLSMQRLAQLPMPTLAAIEGVALGGGLELALAADIRIASTSATLGLPETSLAIVPGAGGTQRLPRLIGVAKAKQLVWTAARVGGTKAHEYGMVEELVEPGQALAAALEMAGRIAANGPVAIRASKIAMDDGIEAATIQEALEIERHAYAKVLPTDDRLEGLAAFKEGRKPSYRGL